MSVELKPVVSSNIESVGYDEAESKLIVKFKHGGRYAYDSVPPNIHADLINAQRVGKYFHACIKGKYEFKKLD